MFSVKKSLVAYPLGVVARMQNYSHLLRLLHINTKANFQRMISEISHREDAFSLPLYNAEKSMQIFDSKSYLPRSLWTLWPKNLGNDETGFSLYNLLLY